MQALRADPNAATLSAVLMPVQVCCALPDLGVASTCMSSRPVHAADHACIPCSTLLVACR